MSIEGQILKNKITGTEGLNVSEVARRLGMSPQGLDYHLKKTKVSKVMVEKVFGILKAQEISNELENASKKINGSLGASPKIVNPNIGKDSYINSPFLNEVLDMGKLLQWPLEKLLRLQQSAKESNDWERHILITEVVRTKEELEAAKEKIESLKEFIETLKENITLLKKPPTK